jgi:hypothetical protein
MGAKWPECEVDYPPPSSAEVKKAWSWTLLLPVCFNRVERGNFNSTEPICGNLMFLSERVLFSALYKSFGILKHAFSQPITRQAIKRIYFAFYYSW